MEIHAPHARGWSLSRPTVTPAAIARRSRSTRGRAGRAEAGASRELPGAVPRLLRASVRGGSAPADGHATWGAHRGRARSYPTVVRELRRLQLRPLCLVCQQRRGRAPTVELNHPPGEGIQWDWPELPEMQSNRLAAFVRT